MQVNQWIVRMAVYGLAGLAVLVFCAHRFRCRCQG